MTDLKTASQRAEKMIEQEDWAGISDLIKSIEGDEYIDSYAAELIKSMLTADQLSLVDDEYSNDE